MPRFRRQFLRKIWLIHLAFLFLFHVRYSPRPWPYLTRLRLSHDRSNRSTPLFFSTTFQNFPYISDLSEISSFQHITKLNYKYCIFPGFFLKFRPSMLVKCVFLLKAAFTMMILCLISHVNLASFVIVLPNGSCNTANVSTNYLFTP